MASPNTIAAFDDYKVIKVIYHNDNNEIYLAERISDGKKVTLKKASVKDSELSRISKLGHEYDILKDLEHPGIPSVYDFSFDGNVGLLAREYVEGNDLKHLLFESRLNYEEIIEIMIKLAEILKYVHDKSVIHKDISPGNILLTESGDLKLIDFGISSHMSSKTSDMLSVDNIEGTLNYISPEQTGRTVYSVTRSSDFYSLGILMFELLAGKLPFDSVDPLEIVHFHLSRKPLSLKSIITDIPNELDQIVFKLLEKNPDDRYQNAAGLIHDLQIIKDHFKTGKPITGFQVGANDVISKYQQTQKIYGREKELEALKVHYREMFEVRSIMTLVSGYSGVGKSELIRQLRLPIIDDKGTFISGKFDQFKKDIPYYAFIEAIKEFIRNLLSEPDEMIDAWKLHITHTLGKNASLITDVIPQLTLIIGEQPPVAKLQPAEQESRFNKVLLDFIYTLSTSDSPLVIFLDDLQWADLSSLNLIKRILENPREDSIMLIGAYRDNEVDQSHPLMITLKQIDESGGQVRSIHLNPLDIQTTIQITEDSYGMNNEDAQKLASLVFSKTKGNPFFIHSFLKSIYDKELISYDQNQWKWDQTTIEQLDYTDNVIDLMTKGLIDLPKGTQRVLQYASVLGNKFNIYDLSSIIEMDQSEVYSHLKPALINGYLNTSDSGYRSLSIRRTTHSSKDQAVSFSFGHDKVQQAAYNLIPQIERPLFHLKSGRMLLVSKDPSQLQDDIFEVLNHFFYSADLIEDIEDKKKITELCLFAGRKAKDSNSYNLAVRYLKMGLQLLPDDSWEKDHDLTYETYIELGECEYLNDNPEQAESHFELLLKRSNTNYEKLKVYYIHSSLYLKIGNTSRSLKLGLEAAELYNIHFPKGTTAIALKAGMVLSKYLLLFSTKYRDPESLYHLEDCEDEELIVLNKFMIDLATSAYQENQNLMMLVVFKIMELYIKHGFTDASGWAFSGFSVVVLSALKLQKKGFDLWDITLKLHERTISPLIKARLSYTVYCFMDHFRNPLREGHERILDLIKACTMNGDQIFTSYTVALYTRAKINAGVNLQDVIVDSNNHHSLIKNSKGGYDFFECFFQFAKALNGQTYRDSWDDDHFDYTETLKRLEEEGNKTKLGFLTSSRCAYLYIIGDHFEALKVSEQARKYADNFIGDQQEVAHSFYTSLTIAALYDELSDADKKKYLKTIKKSLKDFKRWSHGCPENYSQHLHLIRAEYLAIQNKPMKALEEFEKAIENSIVNRFTHVAAIANERASEFCRKTGLHKQSRFYITEAYRTYQSWGAHAKCEKLKKAHPHLASPEMEAERSKKNVQISTTASSSTELDLASVIKATQNIASQTKYEDLLNNLLQITIENAGAERGCLILEKDQKLGVEAIGVSGSDIIEILPSVPLDQLKIMPESVLNYCWRTKETVVLNDAHTDDRFGSDPYIQKNGLLSVMCMPVTVIGKNIGLLYLENSLINGVFDKSRMELLDMLSGQIGISIENSNLISNLEEKVKERTQEIEKAYGDLQEAHKNLNATQDQLIQQEKLASLGQLTAGIAHEIKNPLNFVNNFSDLSIELIEEALEELREFPSASEEVSDILADISSNLKKIHEHGSRADNIVKSMLLHSRGGSGKMELTDLNNFIKEYVNLSFHGMRAGKNPINVDIQFDLSDEVGDVPVIAEDFSRVIVNLTSNAFDAMRAKLNSNDQIPNSKEFKPVLKVRTSKENEEVIIEIEDNGPGIPDDIKDKILQPFFTTKKGKEGTGLGLSITNDIIKAHGGVLNIDSKENEFSIFTIKISKRGTK